MVYKAVDPHPSAIPDNLHETAETARRIRAKVNLTPGPEAEPVPPKAEPAKAGAAEGENRVLGAAPGEMEGALPMPVGTPEARAPAVNPQCLQLEVYRGCLPTKELERVSSAVGFVMPLTTGPKTADKQKLGHRVSIRRRLTTANGLASRKRWKHAAFL